MAFTLHQQDLTTHKGFATLHLHDSAKGGVNRVVYLVVPVTPTPRLGSLQKTKAARVAAKQALLDAAAAL